MLTSSNTTELIIFRFEDEIQPAMNCHMAVIYKIAPRITATFPDCVNVLCPLAARVRDTILQITQTIPTKAKLTIATTSWVQELGIPAETWRLAKGGSANKEVERSRSVSAVRLILRAMEPSAHPFFSNFVGNVL